MSPTPLPEEEVTLPTMLRQHGYEVASFGKTHFYAPRQHEFDLCADWDEYTLWLHDKGAIPLPADSRVLGRWRPFFDPTRVWLNSDCLPYPAVDADMYGTYLAKLGARYLAEKEGGPFFLYVSFYETHSPFGFPLEFQGRHSPDSFHVPSVVEADLARVPAVFQGLTDDDKRGILAAYATSAEFMDKNVGLLLDALDQSRHADNTLVIFTSDHGYLLGQHGRFEKHCCLEPAVRAALLMCLPEMIAAGRSTRAMIELIDLVPTILDLCDVPAPSNLQGRSFLGLLKGQDSTHRDHVVAEYSDNEEAMIRTERWKLIYTTGSRQRRDGYAPDPPLQGPLIQLFDMESDPEETNNLADSEEHKTIVEHLLRVLADHLVRTARVPSELNSCFSVEEILAQGLRPGEMWHGRI